MIVNEIYKEMEHIQSNNNHRTPGKAEPAFLEEHPRSGPKSQAFRNADKSPNPSSSIHDL